MEHIMMLQKALKMDGGTDSMFDMIDNLKFMENYKMVEIPYNPSNPDILAALQGGSLPGMLHMVLKPSSGPTQAIGGGSKLNYGPIFQSVGAPSLQFNTGKDEHITITKRTFCILLLLNS